MKHFSTESSQHFEALLDIAIFQSDLRSRRAQEQDDLTIRLQSSVNNKQIGANAELRFKVKVERLDQPATKRKSKVPSAVIIVLVLLFHLFLLLSLDQLWSPTPLQVVKSQRPKLNAYMYYANDAIDKTRLQQELPIDNLNSEAVALPNKLKDTQKQRHKEPSIEVGSVNPTKELVKKRPLNDKAELELEALIQAMDKASKPLTADIFVRPKEAITGNAISYFDRSTQDYFSSKNAQLLDSLSRDSANQFTNNKTLSEMDGEMVILVLPEVDTWSEAKTFGSELDPNRIVKQGDTCFRIVKTPTPINPHAENLGYPFRCDGDSVVAALKRAIAKRTYKSAKN